MKNILLSKKIIVVTAMLLIALTIGTFVLFETKCFGNSCGSEAIRGFIKPFLWFGLSASVISSFFLFFSDSIFKGWLKSIASWYLAILFILVATTPVSSSHVMSVDRSQVVFVGMVVLALTAVVYAFWMRSKSVA